MKNTELNFTQPESVSSSHCQWMHHVRRPTFSASFRQAASYLLINTKRE